MTDLYQVALSALNEVVRRIAEFLPNLISALLLLIIGITLAKVFERLAVKLLKALRVDLAAEKAGITAMLSRLGVKRDPADLAGRTLFWIILGLTAVSTLEALRLIYFSQLITQLVAYVPNLVGAALMLFLGLAAARFLGMSVHLSAKNAGLDYGRALGSFVQTFLSAIVLILALAQLGVKTEILTNIVTVLLVSAGLASALALGLGSRAVVSNILAGAFVRRHFEAGREIEVQGLRGVVDEIGPVATILRSGERIITVPNTVLVEHVVQ